MGDVKHQVFISSTFEDLQDERREVMMALLELDAIPAGMELFQASNDEQFRYICDVIDECDYYVLIVAGRYGSTNGAGKSFTELEFDYALKQGKPVLAFVHADIASLPVHKSEKTDAGRQALEAFRARVMGDRMCKRYHSPQELGGQVSRALTQARRRHPTPGWVRASQAGTVEQTAQIAQLQLRIRELEDALKLANAVGLVDPETTIDVPLTLPFTFRAADTTTGERLTMYDDLRVTRREVFHAVAVRMLTAKTEKEMKVFVDKYVEARTARILAHEKSFRNSELSLFAVSQNVFHSLKAYFFAAGLIELDDVDEHLWVVSARGVRLAVTETDKPVAFPFTPNAAWGDGDDDVERAEADEAVEAKGSS